MACHARVNQWLLSQVDRLSLRVTVFDWTREWLPGYTDVQVELVIQEKKFEGRGAAYGEDLALAKASVEALERAVCSHLKLRTTNGLAGHISQAQADLSAKLELIERDRFFCHYLSKKPFYILDAQAAENLKIPYEDVRQRLQKLNMRLNLYEMTRTPETFSVIAVADGRNFFPSFGICAGLGCSLHLEEAIERAMLECLRQTIAILMGGASEPPLSLSEFSGLHRPGPSGHLRLALDKDYAQHTWPHFEKPSSGPIPIENIFLKDIQVTPFSLERLGLSDAPLYFSHAKSNRLQDAFFGMPSKAEINLERIQRFAHKEIHWNDIHTQPHFLG